MAENENDPGEDSPDDLYVIEDTGESLNDFDYKEALSATETGASSPEQTQELHKLREENRKLKKARNADRRKIKASWPAFRFLRTDSTDGCANPSFF